VLWNIRHFEGSVRAATRFRTVVFSKDVRMKQLTWTACSKKELSCVVLLSLRFSLQRNFGMSCGRSWSVLAGRRKEQDHKKSWKPPLQNHKPKGQTFWWLNVLVQKLFKVNYSLLAMTFSCVYVFHLVQPSALISCLDYPLEPIITSRRDDRYSSVGTVIGSWLFDSRLGQQFSCPNLQTDFHPHHHSLMLCGYQGFSSLANRPEREAGHWLKPNSRVVNE
jgi:hypothetical protein